jgi:predicted NUDIX family NTP pyrophosphohydrolase
VPRLSAGILLYRCQGVAPREVLLVHPGGPFWAKKDLGAWSIPKGEYEPGEEPLAVAEREFEEELGKPTPRGMRVDLGELDQSRAKRVRAWAIEGDLDVEDSTSNTFDLEWPPKSGNLVAFPEVDRAAWFDVGEARIKIHPGQVEFLNRLDEAISLDR